MSEVRVELDYSGFDEMRHDPALVEQLTSLADSVALAAGDGFEVNVYDAGSRMVAGVKAATKEAHQKCLDDNVLLYALGGVSGD